jgi:putative membrane protein
MSKLRSMLIFPTVATFSVVIFAGAVSRAQSTTGSPTSDTVEKGKSVVSETTDKTLNLLKGASAGTSADILSRIHEVNETEIYVGKLAIKKGSTEEVKSYGKELVRDHERVEHKVVSLAKAEGVQLSPPAPVSEQLERVRNHDGAVQEMLANVSGNTFDRDFLEAMVEDHQKTIDALKQAQSTSNDPKIKDLIQELLPQLTDHQETAEKLLVKAKKASS